MFTRNQTWSAVPKSTQLETKRRLEDPKLFVRHFLRVAAWGVQDKILDAINKPHARVAVKACHASGKTFTAAMAVLHAMARYKEVIVITTAPTWNQVESVLWPEIRLAIKNGVYPYPKPLTVELRMSEKRFAMGYATSVTKANEGVKFQGYHAAHILIIIDEAPGVDPKIWQAIDGIRAGGDVRILALGNPTIIGGPFEEAFKDKRNGWTPLTISAFDTPNFDGLGISPDGTGIEVLLNMSEEELNANQRPYLTTRSWVKEKYYEWGPGHPLWQARVLGQFPENSDVTLIPLSWVEKCKWASENYSEDEGELHAGIDVAGPGDDETTLAIRRGPKVIFLKAYSHSDPRGAVLADLAPYKMDLKSVKIDSIGIGYNFALHIKDQGYPVVLVNVAETAKDSKRFASKKDQHFWNLRERFQKQQINGIVDDKLIAQLTTIRFSYDNKGRIEIESKKTMRQRGVKSPDRAEAIMLCYAEETISFAGLIEFYEERVKVA